MNEQLSLNGFARDDVFRFAGPASLTSTGERIAAALEQLVEKLGGPTVEEDSEELEPSIGGDRFFSPDEAAKLLRINIQTVRRHVRQGRYGHKDTFGRLWVRQSEIDHLLLARKKIHGK